MGNKQIILRVTEKYQSIVLGLATANVTHELIT
jgi:hypothetical protein